MSSVFFSDLIKQIWPISLKTNLTNIFENKSFPNSFSNSKNPINNGQHKEIAHPFEMFTLPLWCRSPSECNISAFEQHRSLWLSSWLTFQQIAELSGREIPNWPRETCILILHVWWCTHTHTHSLSGSYDKRQQRQLWNYVHVWEGTVCWTGIKCYCFITLIMDHFEVCEITLNFELLRPLYASAGSDAQVCSPLNILRFLMSLC